MINKTFLNLKRYIMGGKNYMDDGMDINVSDIAAKKCKQI